MSDGEEKRVLANPRDKPYGRCYADALGIDLQVTDLCPPGTMYVLDLGVLFNEENPRWEFGVGRIAGLT